MLNAVGKRARRSWSVEEKRRIVEEALLPGASVAEIARRHGMNANLVFTWRRAAQASLDSAVPMIAHVPPSMCPTEFIPIGAFAQAQDVDSTPAADALPSAVAATASHGGDVPRPRMNERPGEIEIELLDGTRLRVDALVSEHALRRVLTVLKAS